MLFLCVCAVLVTADLSPALEEYIWGEERMAGFLPGSREYLHYQLLGFIERNAVNTTEFHGLLERYATFGASDDYRLIKIRALLKQWDVATSITAKDEIIHKLSEYLSTSPRNDHRKAHLGSEQYPSTLPMWGPLIPPSVYLSAADFERLTPAAYPLLDINVMSQDVLLRFLTKGVIPEMKILPKILPIMTFVEQIIPFLPEMTIEQLEEYANLQPEVKKYCRFADALLRKKYPMVADTYENLQNRLRNAHLNEMNGEFCRFMEKEVLFRLLVLGLHTHNMSESEFQRYLKLRKEYSGSPGYMQYINSMDMVVPSLPEEVVIREYEDYYYASEDAETSHYQKWYPDSQDFKARVARAHYLSGRTCSDSTVPSSLIASLAAIRELQFDRNNPVQFSIPDIVSLKIVRKNIPKLVVKVICIDAESYYRSNREPIPSDMNLDGVEAAFEVVIETQKDPLLRVLETVEFEELRGREGLFVIEAMGGGRHARAWVQKGGLQRVSSHTEMGYQMQIFSSDGELMRREHTGVLLDGQLYLQAPDSDFILIPRPSEPLWQTLVLLSGNITQYVGPVRLTPPDYTLLAGYHIETESIHPKHRSFIVVTPQLYLDNRLLPLSSLLSIHAKVTMSDQDEMDIVVGETEQELFSGSFSVPFEPPEEFDSLEIHISGVLKANPGIKVETRKTVELEVEMSRIADAYLRKTSEGYVVQILGKNGEEIRNQVLDVAVTSIFYTEERQYRLESDSMGLIYLGKLTGIAKLQVKFSLFSRSWDINELEERVSYPETLVMHTSDTVNVPVLGSGPVFLMHLVDNSVVKTVEMEVDLEVKSVTLTGLAQGSYQLRLSNYSERVTINVKVYAGEIVGERYISHSEGITSRSQSLPIGINTLEIGRKSIKVQLNGNCKNASLTIALRQFAGTGVETWSDFAQMNIEQTDFYQSLDAKTKYLPSRILDEEYLYVMDRRHASDKWGTSFPVPSLLVRPNLVRSTNTEDQTPNEGTDFQRSQTKSGHMEYSPDAAAPTAYIKMNAQHVSFLAEPALVLTNFGVDEHCSATIGFNHLRKYEIVEVMARGNGSLATRIEAIPNADEIAKKTVSLTENLPNEGGFAEVRSLKVIPNSEFVGLGNEKNAGFVSVSTLAELVSVLRDIKFSLSSWTFLGEWGLKTDPEKLELYEKFASNELNFFLYHKDRDFFSAHIQPLVKAKISKTLIDDIILERPLGKYAVFPQVSLLSSLEKALLSRFEPRLAALLKSQSDANPASLSTIKRLFDLVFKSTMKKANVIENSPRLYHDSSTFYSIFTGGAGSQEMLLLDWESYYVHRHMGNDRSSANEYIENQYLTSDEKGSVAEGFWAEAGERKGSFISEKVVFATNSLREVILALAVTDLPWTKSTSGDRIVLTKEIKSVSVEINPGISVVQFYMTGNSEAKELVQGRKYTSHVVISNLSQESLTVEVLMQIPEGSVSLHHRGELLSNVVQLQAHSLQTLTYEFYFPAPGHYTHTGVYVSQEGVVIQQTPSRQLQVLSADSIVDTDCFTDIALAGNQTAVLTYLESKNLAEVEFDDMLWMLEDQSFFLSVTAVLRQRWIYVAEIWAYSLIHRTQMELREFLSSDKDFCRYVGPYFNSSLVVTGAGEFEYREYFPLVNPRWHPLQGHSRIANHDFRTTYESFLKHLIYKNRIEFPDRLILSQYFIMQHRYEAAQQQLDQISPLNIENEDLKMQYDYLKAYLNPSIATEILQKYNETASKFWQEKFSEMRKEANKQEIGYFANELLNVELKDAKIAIYSEGLAKCELKVRKIDLELMFSRSPFLQATKTASAYTSPSYQQTIALVSGFTVTYTLPAPLQMTNLMLTLDCGNQSWAGLYAKSGLKVQVFSGKGMVRVTDEGGEGVGAAYVKVYVRDSGGKVGFYKDGYTDSKGKFDYSTVTSDDLSTISAFSLLITHDQLGSTVLEIAS